jgi:hypothetical protein
MAAAMEADTVDTVDTADTEAAGMEAAGAAADLAAEEVGLPGSSPA